MVDLGAYWFQLLQSVGIVGGLLLNARAQRAAAKAQRVTTSFQLTKYQRDLYETLSSRSDLIRFFQDRVDLATAPLTDPELRFTVSAILHLELAFEAVKAGMVRIEGLNADAARFINRSIPTAVWLEVRQVQNRDFRDWLDSHMISTPDPIIPPRKWYQKIPSLPMLRARFVRRVQSPSSKR